MDVKTLTFREGDSVIFHYGIKGEFLQEAIVGKVYKNGNFKINRSDSQFRQTGWEVGEEGTWGQEWVEVWSPERALKVQRHKLEVRVVSAANVLIQSVSDIEDHKLHYIAAHIEYVNRSTKGANESSD